MKRTDALVEQLKPGIEGLGFSLWGIEFLPQGKHSVLRVYIDCEKGVGLEDCTQVSRMVSRVLDVEEAVSGPYNLEVSSPGLKRRFFSPEQYAAYLDHTVSVRLHALRDGRRQLTGQLVAVEETGIQLDCELGQIMVEWPEIEKAHLE